MYVLQKPKQK